MSRHRIDWKARLQRVCEMIDAGKTVAEIATAFDASEAQVRAMLRHYNIDLPPPAQTISWRRSRARVEQMIASGMTVSEIAAAMGCDRKAASHGIRDLGLRVTAAANRRARSEGVRKWWAAHPEKRAEWGRMAAQRWRDGIIRATPNMIAELARGREIGHQRRMAWCPPHLRDDYRVLMVNGGMRAAEARAALQPTIAKFRRTHEGRLWLLRTGQAEIVGGVFRAK